MPHNQCLHNRCCIMSGNTSTTTRASMYTFHATEYSTCCISAAVCCSRPKIPLVPGHIAGQASELFRPGNAAPITQHGEKLDAEPTPQHHLDRLQHSQCSNPRRLHMMSRCCGMDSPPLYQFRKLGSRRPKQASTTLPGVFGCLQPQLDMSMHPAHCTTQTIPTHPSERLAALLHVPTPQPQYDTP